MTIFLLLLTKLIPLYATVGLGFLAGKKLKVDRASIAAIVLYLLVPIIMFYGVVKAEWSPSMLLLPLVTYGIAVVLNGLFMFIARRFYKDATANIIACAAGTGNTGYFGLPIAIVLFDEATVAAYIMLILGTTLAESSVGYFLAARGHATWGEALRKTLRLPAVYAFIFGVAVQTLHIPIPAMFWDFVANIRGAYTVLGMMIVGLGIAHMPRLTVDAKFISLTYTAKFIMWPALAMLFCSVDAAWLHLYNENIHRALMLLSIVPMAANTVVIATLLDIAPGKVASAVLLSTAVAVVYVPSMIALFIVP